MNHVRPWAKVRIQNQDEVPIRLREGVTNVPGLLEFTLVWTRDVLELVLVAKKGHFLPARVIENVDMKLTLWPIKSSDPLVGVLENLNRLTTAWKVHVNRGPISDEVENLGSVPSDVVVVIERPAKDPDPVRDAKVHSHNRGIDPIGPDIVAMKRESHHPREKGHKGQESPAIEQEFLLIQIAELLIFGWWLWKIHFTYQSLIDILR